LRRVPEKIMTNSNTSVVHYPINTPIIFTEENPSRIQELTKMIDKMKTVIVKDTSKN